MEIIGWISSVLLVVTIGWQIYRQWSTEQSQGVSRWLFAGQLLAQFGFILYSLAVKNWIFVFTNAALLLENLLGLAITIHHKNARKTQ